MNTGIISAHVTHSTVIYYYRSCIVNRSIKPCRHDIISSPISGFNAINHTNWYAWFDRLVVLYKYVITSWPSVNATAQLCLWFKCARTGRELKNNTDILKTNWMRMLELRCSMYHFFFFFYFLPQWILIVRSFWAYKLL